MMNNNIGNNIKTWEQIKDEFEAMNQMSCVPRFKKLKSDYITDENKSVKWNREQIELNHAKYNQVVKELNTKKNKERDRIYKDIILKIRQEVGFNLDEKSASMIWEYAYSQGHSDGFSSILSWLNEIINLVHNLLCAMENKKS